MALVDPASAMADGSNDCIIDLTKGGVATDRELLGCFLIGGDVTSRGVDDRCASGSGVRMNTSDSDIRDVFDRLACSSSAMIKGVVFGCRSPLAAF